LPPAATRMSWAIADPPSGGRASTRRVTSRVIGPTTSSLTEARIGSVSRTDAGRGRQAGGREVGVEPTDMGCDGDPTSTPAAVEPPPAAEPPPRGGIDGALWSARLATGARASYEWVTLPRVRLWLVGLALLFVGGIVMTNSVWTLPLVIAGALMVITAWVGHRLDGRVALQWGEAGAQLDLRATVRAAGPASRQPASASAAVAASASAGVPVPVPAPAAAVIEGEAHTVEIDVAELKALIAAAEAVPPTVPDATAPEAEPARERVGADEIRVTRIPR
jgi:hypothetical protein